jgi:hypothetical protein
MCEVRFWQGQEIVHIYGASRPNLWPIQPPFQLVLRVFSPRVKQVECEADHTHSCSAKVPFSARLCVYVSHKNGDTKMWVKESPVPFGSSYYIYWDINTDDISIWIKRHLHDNGTHRFWIMCRQFTNIKILHVLLLCYNDSLQAGWYRDRIPANVKFSAVVKSSPGSNQSSYTVGTRFLSWGKLAGLWHRSPCQF